MNWNTHDKRPNVQGTFTRPSAFDYLKTGFDSMVYDGMNATSSSCKYFLEIWNKEITKNLLDFVPNKKQRTALQ
jgi:hypothetical protein